MTQLLKLRIQRIVAQVTQTYQYRFNPVESNYRDGPKGHKNIQNSLSERNNRNKNNKIYREKSIPMTALWCPALIHYLWLTLSWLKHINQPIIVVILIIYSVYLLKDLVEL